MSRERFPVVVHVLLLRNEMPGNEMLGSEEVFLLRRANTGFMDGYFALPGGHQEQGESVSQAARRECAEEAGVTLLELQPRCVMPYRSGRHQGLNFLFESTRWQGEPGVSEPALFDRACWAPLDGLPEPHADWLPGVLDMRATGEWYREFEWD